MHRGLKVWACRQYRASWTVLGTQYYEIVWKSTDQQRRLRNGTSIVTGDKNKLCAQKPNENHVSMIV